MKRREEMAFLDRGSSLCKAMACEMKVVCLGNICSSLLLEYKVGSEGTAIDTS
jgi:hypothetical protein